jgi:hypothetical protein
MRPIICETTPRDAQKELTRRKARADAQIADKA